MVSLGRRIRLGELRLYGFVTESDACDRIDSIRKPRAPAVAPPTIPPSNVSLLILVIKPSYQIGSKPGWYTKEVCLESVRHNHHHQNGFGVSDVTSIFLVRLPSEARP